MRPPGGILTQKGAWLAGSLRFPSEVYSDGVLGAKLAGGAAAAGRVNVL